MLIIRQKLDSKSPNEKSNLPSKHLIICSIFIIDYNQLSFILELRKDLSKFLSRIMSITLLLSIKFKHRPETIEFPVRHVTLINA